MRANFNVPHDELMAPKVLVHKRTRFDSYKPCEHKAGQDPEKRLPINHGEHRPPRFCGLYPNLRTCPERD